ncbi:collagenase [Saprospiraceae bacterium]|nr:collagenase [Saprospiraceae bacterium]
MVKLVKKIALSTLSILGLSALIWTIFLLNPSISYAHSTNIGQVTIYHNLDLAEGTERVIINAIEIIEAADIYDADLKIQLCLNDDKIYPTLYPFAAATAYAFLNKTVIYASEANFGNNYTEFQWEVNNYEIRRYNLTELLAHEFMHNLQHNQNPKYQILSTLGKANWILEGHAEYVSREFKNDGLLQNKIENYLSEKDRKHIGIPVFKLEDGTIQNLAYYKYALIVQYLIDVRGLDYKQLCELNSSQDSLFSAMLDWNNEVKQ